MVINTRWIPNPMIVRWPTSVNFNHYPSYQQPEVQEPVYNYFPASENLYNRQMAFQKINPNLSDVYGGLSKEAGVFGTTANKITDFYNALANDVAQREEGLAQQKQFLANDINQQIASQRDYINSIYWPQGEFTKQINSYYDDLGDYLASEGGRQMADAEAKGMHSGASLWALRAMKNEAYNQAFGNYVKAKEQELNAKEKIQSTLINYMTALRNEYGSTNDKYIIGQYQRANDLLNTISSNLAQEHAGIQKSLLNYKLSKSGGHGNGGQLINVVKEDGSTFPIPYKSFMNGEYTTDPTDTVMVGGKKFRNVIAWGHNILIPYTEKGKTK